PESHRRALREHRQTITRQARRRTRDPGLLQSTRMLEPGAMVAGKLRVERVLGQGGMGTVVVATHVGLDQAVALEVLHAELANQPEVVARFVREARASAKLRNEHICRVTDVGQLDSGEPYIEMELLDGSDLSKLIDQAPLDVPTAVDYVLQA